MRPPLPDCRKGGVDGEWGGKSSHTTASAATEGREENLQTLGGGKWSIRNVLETIDTILYNPISGLDRLLGTGEINSNKKLVKCTMLTF